MVVVGIDADMGRIAYAVRDASGFRAVGTIARGRKAGGVWDDYDGKLRALMRRAASARARVWVEGIYLNRSVDGKGAERVNALAFRGMAEVHGELKMAAREAGVWLDVVMPVTWQSKVLPKTKGRDALKAKAMEVACDSVGREVTQHEADAVCIAEWAWAFAGENLRGESA